MLSDNLKKYFPETYVWPDYLHMTIEVPVASDAQLKSTKYNINERKALLKKIVREAGDLVYDERKNKLVLKNPDLYKICNYYYEAAPKPIILGNYAKSYGRKMFQVKIKNLDPNAFMRSPHITIAKEKYDSRRAAALPPKNIFKNMKLQLAGVRISQKGIGSSDEFHIACTSAKLPRLPSLGQAQAVLRGFARVQQTPPPPGLL